MIINVRRPGWITNIYDLHRDPSVRSIIDPVRIIEISENIRVRLILVCNRL